MKKISLCFIFLLGALIAPVAEVYSEQISHSPILDLSTLGSFPIKYMFERDTNIPSELRYKKNYTEAELIKIIKDHPQTEILDISRQPEMTSNVMFAIKENLPNLKVFIA